MFIITEELFFNSYIDTSTAVDTSKSIYIIWDLKSFYKQMYKQRYEGDCLSVESNF